MFSMIPFRTVSRTPRLYDDRFLRSFFDMSDSIRSAFHVDVRDQGNTYLLDAELPGFKQEEIELSVDNDLLTITANRMSEQKEEKENYLFCERRSGRTQRSFQLEGIDAEKSQAHYENGILSVTLPKLTPVPINNQRKIPIQ